MTKNTTAEIGKYDDVIISEESEGFVLVMKNRSSSRITIKPRRGQRVAIREAIRNGVNPLDMIFELEDGRTGYIRDGELLTLRELPDAIHANRIEARVRL